MHPLLFIIGLALVGLVLLDAFETVVLPRRVTRKFRLARMFYRGAWQFWLLLATMVRGRRRDGLLGFFGPLSLLTLFALWVVGLIIGFALIHWGLRTQMNLSDAGVFSLYLYLSGSSFFTLGFGDVVPLNSWGRVLAVIESGMGFGMLALVLGYLPTMYQAFSRREVSISMLDARAGSPPTAAELVRRHRDDGGKEELRELLRDWERWSAELMESHLSYPVLAYFRSQHDNQSWLAALTTILDTTALLMATESGELERQARLTFAMARHAVVDLSQVFGTAPKQSCGSRLNPRDWDRLKQLMEWDEGQAQQVKEVGPLQQCTLYEPYVSALSEYLRLPLPAWVPESEFRDNWQTSGWEQHTEAETVQNALPKPRTEQTPRL